MTDLLASYTAAAGENVISHLEQLARPLKGLKVVHVNSTREGGGVAEILHKLLPLKRALGIEVDWEVIGGAPGFYHCTKTFHNALQGKNIMPSQADLAAYEEANAEFAAKYGPQLAAADFVFIHDPQPAAVLSRLTGRRGKWIWRCHIDVSQPHYPVWNYLRKQVTGYDASIFSLPEFSRWLPHPQYIIAPSIDPLSEKNIELPPEELTAVAREFDLDPQIPLVVQVSRFDRFKDPLGVIAAYKLARQFTPLQLVLAGGGASDDPEGAAVLEEVREAAADDPGIKVLLLPSDAHRTINALQRLADIVMQKSLKEGFGLTVSEAMWKYKPVIGGDVGGIRLQVVNHYTGFLVNTPEGAALRIRYLLQHPERLQRFGEYAHRHVQENFLITRHLREYLALMVGLVRGASDRIEVSH